MTCICSVTVRQLFMSLIQCFSLVCCRWTLLSLSFAFGNATHTTVNTTTALYHPGDSVYINCCCLPPNDSDIITVKLHKNNTRLCSYLRVKSWIKQSCGDRIRFIWISETKETLYELSDLQLNDSGTYSCTVRRLTPPPEVDLWVERTTVEVHDLSTVVPPVLLMSCVKRPNGLPIILCSYEGFLPATLKQQWMRDGETINSSYSHKHENYTTNEDGSFIQKFYLELPSQIFDETMYYCWVNHSSLNKSLMASIPNTACYERSSLNSVHVTLPVIVAFVIPAVLIVFVIIAVICKCYRSAQHQSAVDMSVTPEPVVQAELQTEVLYSSLGDHHPVPCSRSPSGVWSPLVTTD